MLPGRFLMLNELRKFVRKVPRGKQHGGQHRNQRAPELWQPRRCRVEVVEGGPVTFTFAKDSLPTQSGLRAFKDQKFEQAAVVVLRNAPLLIVVADAHLGRRPAASLRGRDLKFGSFNHLSRGSHASGSCGHSAFIAGVYRAQ